jgi:hypothetical protein
VSDGPRLRTFIDFDEPFAGRQTLCRCWGELLLDPDEPLLVALGAVPSDIPAAYPPRGLPAVVSHEVFSATHLAVIEGGEDDRAVSRCTAVKMLSDGAGSVTYDWSGRWAESQGTLGSHVTDPVTTCHSWFGLREVEEFVRFLSDRRASRLRVHPEDLETIRAILSTPQRSAVKALYGPGDLVEIAFGFPGACPTFALEAAVFAMRALEQTGRAARLVYWACTGRR